MADYTITRTEYGVKIQVRVTDEDGNLPDFTGATVSLHLRHQRKSGLTVDATATVLTPVEDDDPNLEYEWAVNDLTSAVGPYFAQWKAVYAGGEIQFFPNDGGYHDVLIHPELAGAIRLLTPAQIHDHLETDLSDAAIQRLIDDAEAAISSRYGNAANGTDTLEVLKFGGEKHLYLDRPAASISSIVETVATIDTTLAADDYRLKHEGRTLERLDTGTNPAGKWGEEITITYLVDSEQENPQRVMAIIGLVQLALNHRPGIQNERHGDFSAGYSEYFKQREALIEMANPAAGWPVLA